jgi:SAM-dependent methyltransferase
MSKVAQTVYAEQYFNYLVKRGFIQKLIRKIYLWDIRRCCIGRTIDFGCGVGELLQSLPAGSIGFEINWVAVDYCKSKGLRVFLFDPENDGYALKELSENEFGSFTMNHVLEHTENTASVINQLFESCHRLNIGRLVFTVPGIKGYYSDKTHVTFVDVPFFERNALLNTHLYRLKSRRYFPFNLKLVSKFFVHNELRLIFDKVNG